MSETKLNLQQVGSYPAPGLAEPTACEVCHNAKWRTIIVNGVCLECLIGSGIAEGKCPYCDAPVRSFPKQPDFWERGLGENVLHMCTKCAFVYRI